MIDCIFTLDYEIYGNGEGSLKDLVYEPGEKLRETFSKWDARFVNYVEVGEFEQIEKRATDAAIGNVTRQVRQMYEEGFEIALHLHPQWAKARHEGGRWMLDMSEYNLCVLTPQRIEEIIGGSVDYLRRLTGDADFSPISFRAGNWLFQPTASAARVLAKHGLKLDSSVFKGGLQHNHTLDYRRAPRDAYFWKFEHDVLTPNAAGSWIEIPIYTEMVPVWKMPTTKRMSLGNSMGGANSDGALKKFNRLRDFARFRYPLKLDFTRMTLVELTSMMERVIAEDKKDPVQYRPIVAIGHTKDLVDLETVDLFLGFLRKNEIGVATFEEVYRKIMGGNGHTRPGQRAAQVSGVAH